MMYNRDGNLATANISFTYPVCYFAGVFVGMVTTMVAIGAYSNRLWLTVSFFLLGTVPIIYGALPPAYQVSATFLFSVNVYPSLPPSLSPSLPLSLLRR